MASYARRFILNGVKLVAALRDDADHIRQIKAAVQSLVPAAARVITGPRRGRGGATRRTVALASKSRLANASRVRASSSSSNCSAQGLPGRLLVERRGSSDRGVDVINVPDAPRRAHA